jgi:hypothetical protein
MSKDLLEKLRIGLTKTSNLYEIIKDKSLKQLSNSDVLSSKITEKLSQLEKSIEHMNKKLEDFDKEF